MQFLTLKPKNFYVKKFKVQTQPKLNFVDNANFPRRFDSSTNFPLNIFDICLRAIHYMIKIPMIKLTENIQVFRKKSIFFFEKPEFGTF